jgi:hypothetical protein
MWIFTDTGFISVVRKEEHPGVLTVRARDRQSLELLAAKANVEVKRSPKGDYPYRVFVGDGPFIEWFLDRGGDIQYDNFKSRVYETRGSKFVRALNDVWAAMHQVEDDEARSPLLDANGNKLRHSDANELTEEQQIAIAEQFALAAQERVLRSEATEQVWSDDEELS